jgi:hypothetical protein
VDREQSVKKIDAMRRAYQATFDGPMGKEVLKDLAKFCGTGKDGFSKDALEMAHNTGLRKVFLRIQSMLNITDDDIWRMFDE